ncbi:DUF885 domain-containing protein [Caulobacter sp. KR2-114]|uniref:DUF885 domain-containing protein n=1 Tax=Caulobacter sp. KR2-114 TaxID=3400912 RepID=UPI003C035067
MADRREFLMGAAAAGLAVGLPASGLADAPADAGFERMMDDFAHRDLMRSPETATSLGLDTGDLAGLRARLADRSIASVAADAAENARRVAALKGVDRAALSASNQVGYDMLWFVYDQRARADKAIPYGSGGDGAPYVLSQLTGAYQGMPDFLDNQHPIETTADAEAYLARLDALAVAFDQETEMARRDAGLGVIPPDFVLDKALPQMKALHDVAPDASSLVASLVRRARDKGLAGDWQARGAAIFRDRLQPALARQIALVEAWRPKASHDAGVWRLPQGEAYYALSLRDGTTTDLSPEEVHQTGLDLARSLSAEIDAILKAQGMTQGPVGARIHALYQDPKFRYPNTDEAKEKLLADLNRQVEAMQARLPKYFGALPKAPLQIKRVPKFIEVGAPGGYYNQGSLDGKRPGIYWINLRDTAEVPTWTLPTLTYHEGIPGHHLQLSLQQEASLPLIRKMNFFSSYGEGWALYAEQLADEMEVYADDPFGRVGYLQSALFRACRLVVDTGLHHKRWSREKAIQWMADTDGDQVSAVTTEVERYCVWPGQACSYMIGRNTWNRLRAKAKTALGPRFDIRRFHDAGLLAGAVPLTVLETQIDGWLKGQGA